MREGPGINVMAMTGKLEKKRKIREYSFRGGSIDDDASSLATN